MVAYPIDPANPLYPRDSDPAQYGSAEFRALKAYIAGLQFPGSSGTNLFRRNLITNGDLFLDQRYEGAATVLSQVTPKYVGDRFVCTCATGATATGQRITGVLVDNAQYYANISTTVVAVPAVADIVGIRTAVEGSDTGFLGFGLATASACALSFVVSSPIVGLHAVAIRNSATDRSYVATYNVLNANTPQNVSISISGDVTGTWLVTPAKGIEILWDTGSGSNFETPNANVWQAGNFLRTAACVKASGLIGSFKITNIQFEQSVTSTPFEQLTADQKFSRALRYYEKGFDPGTAPANNIPTNNSVFVFNQTVGAAADQRFNVQYKMTKRYTLGVPPICIVYNPSAGTANQVFNGTTAASSTGAGMQSGPFNGYVAYTTAGGSASGNINSFAFTSNSDFWVAGSP
jgi:hypothetical protein